MVTHTTMAPSRLHMHIQQWSRMQWRHTCTHTCDALLEFNIVLVQGAGEAITTDGMTREVPWMPWACAARVSVMLFLCDASKKGAWC